MFYDEVNIQAAAGNGGDGCLSFRREKYIPKGGPDGGDGGDGGCVYLECDRNVGDLRQFHFQPIWKARHGLAGAGRQKKGRNGDDVVLKVPPGTEVYADDGQKRLDLIMHGQRELLLEGGKGGLGNIHFKSAVHQTPRETTQGTAGAAGDYKLVLKTMAEVGLVGFPNAGKSTILGALTNATPKTGAYPFTTIQPMVGVMEDEENFRRLTVADIPGLVEGASENRGLGHRFLRHIERCRQLLFVLDLAGTDGRDPFEDMEILQRELRAYNTALLEKPWMVAGNKVDLPEAEERLAEARRRYGERFFPVSAGLGEGLPALKNALFRFF